MNLALADVLGDARPSGLTPAQINMLPSHPFKGTESDQSHAKVSFNLNLKCATLRILRKPSHQADIFKYACNIKSIILNLSLNISLKVEIYRNILVYPCIIMVQCTCTNISINRTLVIGTLLAI